jgi:putative dimethyl sulfoxide reductase chaperone
MPTRGDRLRLAGVLLSSPGGDAVTELRALTIDHPWLDDSLTEIEALPLAEWQAEHGRLFVGVQRRTPCLPFESAQRDGMMPGPATVAMAALYRGLGLEAHGLPPDYLGSMLECAAFLAESGDRPEAEEELWRKHLLLWLPRYAETLVAESRLLLYEFLGRELTDLCRTACYA